MLVCIVGLLELVETLQFKFTLYFNISINIRFNIVVSLNIGSSFSLLSLTAANKSSAIMSTHIVACLMLYRHRQVRVTLFIPLILAFFIFVPLCHKCASLLKGTHLTNSNTTLSWIIAVRYCHLMAYYCHDGTNRFWPVLNFNDLRIFF